MSGSRYKIEFEDHGQDLLEIECDAETGVITDCGPFHQEIYVGGDLRIDTSKLETFREVCRIKNGQPAGTFKWLMVRLWLDDRKVCDVDGVA